MDEQRKEGQSGREMERRPPRSSSFWLVIMIASMIGIMFLFLSQTDKPSQIRLSYFLNLLEGRDFNGDPIIVDDKPVHTLIEEVEFADSFAYGTFTTPPPPEPGVDKDGKIVQPESGEKLERKFFFVLPPNGESRNELEQRITSKGIRFDIRPQSQALNYYTAFFVIVSLGLLIFMFLSLRRSQNQMMGGGGFLSSFSRSPAKRYEATAKPITFNDVAGLEGVKADLNEIVEFLKEPAKFRKLGGRVPKGVLLIGPPGTGKTLLARAVAGEADVPFFSVNGSEFIQMFVGVGASRVRDLFATAKAQGAAIIFIDEIDAVGRQRGAGLGGGHDEREQTLNQILGEMDGFDKQDSVIVVAATNRPDVLDPALLRPGRFDRHITVSRPTMKGRFEIFKVHVREVPLGPDVDLHILAQATVGMTGADIQNLVNEAALWAARQNKSVVEMEDFYYAHDKVLMGAKREEVLSDIEKERTAYHEAGHTLAAWYLENATPVHKVTVIPRGRALGVTQMVPDEERMNISENEIRDSLVVLLAGRAAEKLVYDEFTVGAENDLERATSMARRMVTQWGMSERLGPVSFKMTDEDPFLGREIHQNRHFSEHTMEIIDDEVTQILNVAAKGALELLREKREKLETLTRALVREEELDRHAIEELIGPSVHKKAVKVVGDNASVVDSSHVETNGAADTSSEPASTVDAQASEHESNE
ncbi:MAG: ATP-dependent zinc metalloprotease FtsH [Pirellulaceae bacterium]